VRAISVGLVVGLSWLFLPVSLCAQRPGAGSLRGPSVADVAILVREALGTPLPAFAVVRISSLTGSYHQTASTKENSEALFEGVPLGVYVVEVSATGYRTTTEEIELLVEGARNAFYISLSPEGTSPPQPTTSAPPVLAPKARKALDEALEALRKDDLEKAQKHLDAARKLAPNDPEVSYLYGVLAVKRNNLAEAQSHLERAVAILPRQGSAWAVLGVVFLRRNDTAKAISSLEQAVIYEPDGWQARGLLAATFLREKELEKARPHAERAVELTKGKIPGFRLVLAQILAGLGKMESAEQQLNQLLQEHPNTPDATGARRMLAEWGRRHAGLSA